MTDERVELVRRNLGRGGIPGIWIAEMLDAYDEQAARLAAVRSLHHPSTDHPDGTYAYCVGCWDAGGMDGAPSWPCDTIRALEPVT